MAPRVASRQRILKVKDQAVHVDGATKAEIDARQDASDEAAVADKLAAKKSSDKLASVDLLEDREWVASQSITQSFGRAAIDHFKGDVDAMPRWRFTRRYLGSPVILVDLFRREQDYAAADVEARRALVKALGGKYAALGPFHSRLPHADAKLRAKYPSMVEQLETE